MDRLTAVLVPVRKVRNITLTDNNMNGSLKYNRHEPKLPKPEA
jgi:hypothetical protein